MCGPSTVSIRAAALADDSAVVDSRRGADELQQTEECQDEMSALLMTATHLIAREAGIARAEMRVMARACLAIARVAEMADIVREMGR